MEHLDKALQDFAIGVMIFVTVFCTAVLWGTESVYRYQYIPQGITATTVEGTGNSTAVSANSPAPKVPLIIGDTTDQEEQGETRYYIRE